MSILDKLQTINKSLKIDGGVGLKTYTAEEILALNVPEGMTAILADTDGNTYLCTSTKKVIIGANAETAETANVANALVSYNAIQNNVPIVNMDLSKVNPNSMIMSRSILYRHTGTTFENTSLGITINSGFIYRWNTIQSPVAEDGASMVTNYFEPCLVENQTTWNILGVNDIFIGGKSSQLALLMTNGADNIWFDFGIISFGSYAIRTPSVVYNNKLYYYDISMYGVWKFMEFDIAMQTTTDVTSTYAGTGKAFFREIKICK